MRWRFTDSVTQFEPWVMLTARKAISLEEYSLLKPFGLKSYFPRSLVIETCVSAAQWFVTASSGFGRTCLVEEVRDFSFTGSPGMGDSLLVRLTVINRDADGLEASFKVTTASGVEVGFGTVTFALIEMNGVDDAENVEALWREICR